MLPANVEVAVVEVAVKKDPMKLIARAVWSTPFILLGDTQPWELDVAIQGAAKAAKDI